MASSAATASATGHSYQLSDDLARLCLPQEFKDSYRNLAWANSICALFLAVGLVGLKPPPVVVRQINDPVEAPKVTIVEPQEPPKPEEIKPDVIPDEQPVERPQTPAIVVVALPTPGIKFQRQVQISSNAVVAITSNPMAATPPPKNDYVPPVAAPTAQKFTPNAGNTDGGFYPKPDYPLIAKKNRYQGTVTLDLEVDAAGRVTSVKVQKSSGYSMLDDAAIDVVKNRWRFPPGEPRLFYWLCTFEMTR